MLSLALILALDALQPAIPPAGPYRYDAILEGKSVGRATVTISRNPQGVKLEEYGESHLQTGDSYIHSTTVFDANLIPTAYSASYKVQDDQMQAAVTFDQRSAAATIGSDKKTFQLGGSSKTFVVLDASAASGFVMLPSQMRAFKNADTTVLVPGLELVSFLSVLQGVTPLRPPAIPPSEASLSFAGEAPFVEWYDPTTLIVDEVDIPGQNLRIIRRRSG